MNGDFPKFSVIVAGRQRSADFSFRFGNFRGCGPLINGKQTKQAKRRKAALRRMVGVGRVGKRRGWHH